MINIVKTPAFYTLICEHCDSILTYARKDLDLNYYEQLGIKCPVCGRFTLHTNRIRQVNLTDADNVVEVTQAEYTKLLENNTIDKSVVYLIKAEN